METVGRLAAFELLVAANRACKKVATELKEAGEKLGCRWEEEAFWSFLQSMSAALAASRREIEETDSRLKELQLATHNTMQGLAERRIERLMDECLGRLANETVYLSLQVSEGHSLRSQYEEGLITSTEYLNSLINKLAEHKGT